MKVFKDVDWLVAAPFIIASIAVGILGTASYYSYSEKPLKLPKFPKKDKDKPTEEV